MATKFSCHSICDGILLRVFSCTDIHDMDVRNISLLECVCVLICMGQKIKSRLEIVGVSVEVARD